LLRDIRRAGIEHFANAQAPSSGEWRLVADTVEKLTRTKIHATLNQD